MENISIKKVETKREMDDFVKFTNWLYADCPYYVPDLEMDIRNTFNPRKNAGLEYSVLQPFIAYNEAGKPVGRIAGMHNGVYIRMAIILALLGIPDPLTGKKVLESI